MVNEEITLFCVKRFEYPEKQYINVTNYYYYYYYYYYGTKNGSSMASLEEPFEAPLFLRVQELWDTSQILIKNSDFFLWFVSLYLAILILQFWLFSHSYMNWGVFTFSPNSEFIFHIYDFYLAIANLPLTDCISQNCTFFTIDFLRTVRYDWKLRCVNLQFWGKKVRIVILNSGLWFVFCGFTFRNSDFLFCNSELFLRVYLSQFLCLFCKLISHKLDCLQAFHYCPIFLTNVSLYLLKRVKIVQLPFLFISNSKQASMENLFNL